MLDCWSENVSRGGIGLVGRSGPAEATVGMRLDVRLALPDLSEIEGTGTVAWVRRTGVDQVALGVALDDIAVECAERLARFVAASRFRVVVVGADAARRAVVADAVDDLVAVEFVDVEQQVPRFDVAAVVLCDRLPVERPATGAVDIDPRAVVIGRWTSDELLPHFEAGRVSSVLGAAPTPLALRAALFEACREWGVRTELRSTTLRFARELYSLKRPTTATQRAAQEMVAESPPMRDLLEQIAVVAPRKVVVLVEGETGTGKERIARAVHDQSGRARRPFVIQDCGTLTETLLDSELFGHVRGAFTGAHADHPGIFVVADGGTVFLDEIENTSPALQAKLLRVLETGEIRPVGGSRGRVVDVRVVAATNTSLRDAVKAGRFRADLYYRLSVFPLSVPPLRARGTDVRLLVERLAAAAADTHGMPTPPIAPAALEALLRHEWPGNVRQLKNTMERAVLLSAGRAVELFDLPPDIRGGGPAQTTSLDDKLAAYERDVIAAALADSGGVISRAAALLRVNRVTLARRARALGVTAR